ncbi:hypothetical protein CJ030_MR6G018047 [Morella rubra]|uniref:Uncharacterized protein n=1 Tax=Morella rubra TaxID=262757 RepID=A0A6A1VEC1_9ROSI|nr:hypothetical protein CJ030_MR6G018047 [Morella rubra]
MSTWQALYTTSAAHLNPTWHFDQNADTEPVTHLIETKRRRPAFFFKKSATRMSSSMAEKTQYRLLEKETPRRKGQIPRTISHTFLIPNITSPLYIQFFHRLPERRPRWRKSLLNSNRQSRRNRTSPKHSTSSKPMLLPSPTSPFYGRTWRTTSCRSAAPSNPNSSNSNPNRTNLLPPSNPRPLRYQLMSNPHSYPEPNPWKPKSIPKKPHWFQLSAPKPKPKKPN